MYIYVCICMCVCVDVDREMDKVGRSNVQLCVLFSAQNY